MNLGGTVARFLGVFGFPCSTYMFQIFSFSYVLSPFLMVKIFSTYIHKNLITPKISLVFYFNTEICLSSMLTQRTLNYPHNLILHLSRKHPFKMIKLDEKLKIEVQNFLLISLNF